MAKTVTRQQFYGTLSALGLVLALILLIGSGLLWKARNFADGQVHSQLAQEHISFPPAGSNALDPKEFPGLQRYAGQPVDNGPKAKAYANEFIWAHMIKASGGKTYAEISSQAQAHPNDQKLAALKNTLFQGDALRTSLLTAYAFSVFGMVAKVAALICLLGGAIVALVSFGTLVKARS